MCKAFSLSPQANPLGRTFSQNDKVTPLKHNAHCFKSIIYDGGAYDAVKKSYNI